MMRIQKNIYNKKLIWLWLPVGFIVTQLVAELIVPRPVLKTLYAENGLHELLQFAVIAYAMGVAVVTLAKAPAHTKWAMRIWIGFAALCCFYVAGEEISWGQHIVNWSTPELWQTVNDQAETNLHNTSSWLDQKPRLILLLGVIIGGLFIPLAKHVFPRILPQNFAEIYPESTVWVTALLALLVKITDKISGITGYVVFERASEIEELYLFYFVLLYLLSMRQRICAPSAQTQ